MVAAMIQLREDDEQLFLSALDQNLLDEKINGMRKDLRTHKSAVRIEVDNQFNDETGRHMTDAKRRPGKPRRNTQEARAKGRAAKAILAPGGKAA